MNTLLRRGAIAAAVLAGALVAAVPALTTGQAGTTLTADVTAQASWTRTFNWTIDKSVAPDTWNLFDGDSGTSLYTVQLAKTGYTDAAKVTGQVCVTNGGAVATENLTIATELRDGVPPPDDLISTTPVDLTGNPVLDPGETGCYPYEILVAGPHAGGGYKVTANITITNHSGHLGVEFGPSPSATTTMPASPTLVNDTVGVTDTNGDSWQFHDSGSVTYTKTFGCDADEGSNANTATITQTGQSDGASLAVNCYALDPSKTAETSLTRTYHWTIDKSADQSALTLALGQSFLVNYSVLVDTSGSTDSDWAVAGVITISNPAPIDAVLNGVADVVSTGIPADVNCEVDFPYTLAAGGTLTCKYSADLPDAASRTNTVTVTQQNFDYGYLGSATPAGTTDTTGSAAVDFADATVNLVDETADVSDSYAGLLGDDLGVGVLPKTYTYSRTIGPYATCGSYQVLNTASFLTVDTGATGSDDWTVDVNVPCGGCTLTIGYWKTHAGFGPQADMVTPLLPVWLGTPVGAKSVHVTTAAKAVELLSKSGEASNGINKLYAQLLGAKLNIADGADGSAVAATIAAADAYLATHNGADWSSLTKAQQKPVLAWATALDTYNNGLTGPGHCTQ